MALSKGLSCLALSSLAMLAQPALATGDAYPTAPVNVIVPWPTGGSADPFARFFSSELSKKWEQSVVVQNRPGANAMIGTAQVARSKPDGYTLLAVLGNHTMNPAMYPSMQFDTAKDFQSIALLALAPNVLVVRKDFPASNMKEFIAELKKQPGKYSYASSGAGGTPHLAGALFAQQSGTKILHVPYKGAGPAMTDLIGGTVDMSFATLSSALPHISAGTVRALAVTHGARVSQLPDTPTMDESGVPGVHVSTWYGFMGPAGMPQKVVDKIAADLKEIRERDSVKKMLSTSLGSVDIYEDSQTFEARVQKEITYWKQVVKEAGISLN